MDQEQEQEQERERAGAASAAVAIAESRRHFATTNDGSSLLSVINDKTDEEQDQDSEAGEALPLRMPHKLAN